ncbi:hypothetical protein P4C99_12370 [Pontiellaceae bacterium B1224]|nr:hypothetical protein [Pontiellaceae bacterium B1224]
MPELINQFENHQVHDDLRSAITPTEEIKSNSEGLTPDAIERIDRISFVLSEMQRRLGITDPLLVPINPLNKLQAPLTQISSHLSNFQSNKNEGHIQNAHNQIENILVHLSQIPVPITSSDMDAIREAAIGLRRSVGQHLRHLEDEARGALTQVTTLEGNVSNLQSVVERHSEETSALLQKFEQQFESAEESRQENFTSKEDEFHRSTQDLLDAKREEWTEIITKKQNEYDELYESINYRLDALETKFKDASNTVLDEMQERLIDAEKIVGVITDTGMIGGYQRIANSEKTSALFWRVVAFISLIVLVGFAITLFVVSMKEGFVVTASVTLTRGFVAVAVGILAGYAAKQADKHERVQRLHRKMELELASIAPYLHEFPEEEARKIKTDLAMKMFAQHDVMGSKESKKTTQSALNLLELALDSIKALIGK